MIEEKKDIIMEEVRKMIPNVLLLIGIWWIGLTNGSNNSVARLDVQMQEITRRLDKIEEKVDIVTESVYPVVHLQQELESLRRRVEKLERNH